MATYLGINLHDDDPHYLNDFSTTLLNDFYIKDGETIKQRFATPASAFSYGDKEFAQRIYDYVHKGWLIYSSPVNSNAPAIEWPSQMTVGSEYARQWLRANVDDKHKGMPISCFLSYVPDTIDGQIDSDKELAYMSIIGGGVGKHLQMRGVTKKSPGAIPYVKKDDGAIQYYKQGETRKGSVAHYLDVSHPDIQEFVNVRVPTGGDINRKAFNVHNAVNINYAFLDAVKRGDDWNLINPHNGEVTDTIPARELWQQILEARYRTGEPYINNVEEANRKLPEAQRDAGLKVHGSNLCVAPETQILTDNGYRTVSELEGESVNVWNGEEWSEVTVIKTGENQELIKVYVEQDGDDGSMIYCTPYHKFYLYDGTVVDAKDLKPDMVLEEWINPQGCGIYDYVVSVEKTDRRSDTYCVTEPKRHRVVFNGILTGNCDEIHLPTDEQRSAVCCLSSVNLAMFDEWKDDPLFIEDCVRFLDNVLQFFIDIAPKGLEKAVYSATQERAIGLGMLGWHTLLQRRSIPWESGGFGSAIQLCDVTARHIKQRAVEASEKLAGERGEAPDMIGTGRRNSHLMAVAPNANSGIIAGVSASIEPIRANCYTHRTRAGSFLVRNKELEQVLLQYGEPGRWLDEQWASIMQHGGSVQHLEYLTDHERSVFKTALEINQLWVVEHARIRQSHVCQGQSVNLFFPAGTDKATFNRVHLAAFSENGSGAPLKGLYYCRTEAKQKADQVSVKVERKALADYATQETNEPSCLSCEG